MDIQFFGATGEVTGSCYLITSGDKQILLECGLVQGPLGKTKNREPFPFDPEGIDAVIISHAHLDHSGRLPLLVKLGYRGPIYTHKASVDLLAVMLKDSAYLQEKEVLWENKKRQRKGLELLTPLYTQTDVAAATDQFVPLNYHQQEEILTGITVCLSDAGHILGSSIVTITSKENSSKKRLVFSGDLGHRGAPILRDPELIDDADLVVMESTYGDRLHRSWQSTWQELGDIISNAAANKGNILIPAFTIGRTQELLYAFKEHYDEWNLDQWEIFLDSPMGIEATEIYSKHAPVYDSQARQLMQDSGDLFALPNLHMSERTEYSIKLNQIRSGAIIIAGSGMCSGGRIKHHLKHNIWRNHCHLLMVGFQARGTLGRALVDGTRKIRLWGETMQVNAQVHTIGGLSAHADQHGLCDWYANFENQPPLVLVHGELEKAIRLKQRIGESSDANVTIADYAQKISI